MSIHLATPHPGTNTCDNVAAIQSRKCQSEQSQDNEDTTHPESDWKKEKVRTIAGPNQQELDAEHVYCKQLESYVAQMEQQKQYLHTQLEEKTNALEEELESKEVDTAAGEDLIGFLQSERQAFLIEKEAYARQLEELQKQNVLDKRNTHKMQNKCKKCKLNCIQYVLNNLQHLGTGKECYSSTDQRPFGVTWLKDVEQYKCEAISILISLPGDAEQAEKLEKMCNERDEALQTMLVQDTDYQCLLRKDRPQTSKASHSNRTSTFNSPSNSECTPSTDSNRNPTANFFSTRMTPSQTPSQTSRHWSCTSQLPKEGSKAHDQLLKQTTFGSLVMDKEKLWRAICRCCFSALTGMSHLGRFNSYSPVSEEIVNDFASCTGPGPNEEDDTCFRLYFGKGWRQTAWNLAVINNMIKRIIINAEEAKLGPPLSSDSMKKSCIHENGDCLETMAEAGLRKVQYKQSHSCAVHSTTRKKSKLEHCTAGVKELLEDRSQTALARKKWEMISQLLQALAIEGQSSKDTDSENNPYPTQPTALLIKVPHFRHHIIGELVENLDRAIEQLCILQWHQSGIHVVPRPSHIHIRSGQKPNEEHA
ncbi:hypothetical protein BT96DRAFT_946429 [Gymnopus androsaceus JB14]|uniref:Uncharacterized protein n=1 Tax=Gymnopus androsaceus JB14 TaxID=1447944 RepID=A0A6A4GW27_9AGAR|nr:hypothetical protein BT96DRAFT_946429 [Gymnopus androsaceus JB14]